VITPNTPVPPDNKDWTWVLQRRCPECGFDARTFARENTGALIRTNAAAWPLILAAPDAASRPSADVWSPLEYACHVRDVFRIYDERLRRMLTEDDPRYENWDQDETAVTDRYSEQESAAVATELVTRATRLADRFDAVSGVDWDRPGTRSDGAHFTVESFARYLVHDPVHHLWDVGVR
jgi:hypothetical protein